MGGKVRVCIATTAGPVQIDTIGPGVGALCSVTVNREPKNEPISNEYHDFVRHVIAPQFGEQLFRMNLNGSIEESNNSWQLAVFVAHGLGDRLAERDEPFIMTAWVTGAVGTDLSVQHVRHVDRKIATSVAMLDQANSDGRPVLMILPEANRADMGPDVLRAPVHFARTAQDAFEAVNAAQAPGEGLALPMHQLPGDKITRPIAWSRVLVAAAAVCVLVGVIVVLMMPNETPSIDDEVLELGLASDADENLQVAAQTEPKVVDETADNLTEPSIFIAEIHPGAGETCASVVMKTSEPVFDVIGNGTVGLSTTSRSTGACGLALGLDNLAEGWRGLLSVRVTSGGLVDQAQGSSVALSANGPVVEQQVLWSGYAPFLSKTPVMIEWNFEAIPADAKNGDGELPTFEFSGIHTISP
jgi:hypothetical protein